MTHQLTEQTLREEFDSQLEKFLADYTARHPHSRELGEIIHYGLLSGDAKRIRPLLAYATALAAGGQAQSATQAAIAVEVIHCYSLIHDDLPAMDDDDIRRGMPSCHAKFGEARAIITGDLMQVVAFDAIMLSPETAQRPRMLSHLIQASGDLVCGQAMDLRGEQEPLSKDEMVTMHRLKCGALIKTAMQLGVLSQPQVVEDLLRTITQSGELIGLAFQVRDDLLDEEEEGEAHTGQYKSTYPGIFGAEYSRSHLQELHEEALAGIAKLGSEADFLRYLFGLMTSLPQQTVDQ